MTAANIVPNRRTPNAPARRAVQRGATRLPSAATPEPIPAPLVTLRACVTTDGPSPGVRRFLPRFRAQPPQSNYRAGPAPCGVQQFRSGRRDSNPRRPPWQGGTLPLSYSRGEAGEVPGGRRSVKACARPHGKFWRQLRRGTVFGAGSPRSGALSTAQGGGRRGLKPASIEGMEGSASVLLDVNFELVSASGTAPWWHDSSVLGSVFRATRELGLWFDFGYVGREGAKQLKAMPPLDELIEQTTAWEERGYVLHALEQGGLDGSSLSLSLRAASLRLMLTVAPEQVEAERDELCERLIELAVRARAAFGEGAWLAEESCVRVPELEEERTKPPLEHPVLTAYALVALVDPAFFAERGRRFPEEHLERDLKKLRSAAMPEGASREQRGALMVFRWTTQPLDLAAMRQACERGERWFAKVLDLPPPEGWNAEGDAEVDVSGFEPHPPLTLYEADSERGFKTLAAAKSGKVPKVALDELQAWLEAGALPDGTALAELGVIVPAREAALKLRGTLEELGVSQVVYTDNDGVLWDPFAGEPGGEEEA